MHTKNLFTAFAFCLAIAIGGFGAISANATESTATVNAGI